MISLYAMYKYSDFPRKKPDTDLRIEKFDNLQKAQIASMNLNKASEDRYYIFKYQEV